MSGMSGRSFSTRDFIEGEVTNLRKRIGSDFLHHDLDSLCKYMGFSWRVGSMAPYVRYLEREGGVSKSGAALLMHMAKSYLDGREIVINKFSYISKDHLRTAFEVLSYLSLPILGEGLNDENLSFEDQVQLPLHMEGEVRFRYERTRAASHYFAGACVLPREHYVRLQKELGDRFHLIANRLGLPLDYVLHRIPQFRLFPCHYIEIEQFKGNRPVIRKLEVNDGLFNGISQINDSISPDWAVVKALQLTTPDFVKQITFFNGTYFGCMAIAKVDHQCDFHDIRECMPRVAYSFGMKCDDVMKRYKKGTSYFFVPE